MNALEVRGAMDHVWGKEPVGCHLPEIEMKGLVHRWMSVGMTEDELREAYPGLARIDLKKLYKQTTASLSRTDKSAMKQAVLRHLP